MTDDERRARLATRHAMAPGYHAASPEAATRAMTVLHATEPATGGWYTSRPRWTLAQDWLGDTPEPVSATTGYREIVRQWLYSFGPGTENDIVWWLGATQTVVRTALADLGAVPVTLDTGDVGSWNRCRPPNNGCSTPRPNA